MPKNKNKIVIHKAEKISFNNKVVFNQPICKIKKIKKHTLTVVLMMLSISVCFAQTNQLLESSFQTPPNQYRPQTWMHVLDGNMSKEGLTKDLEALADAGVGGVLLFNISYRIPNGKVTYNSPEHIALLKHAAAESERLGLNFGIHNCDGWSASGGPWITPEQSMKMVVHSETIVKGGKKSTLKLPQPTTRKGYYRDLAVLAYPSFQSELDDANNMPTISSSDKELDIKKLTDSKIDTFTVINGSEKNPASIIYAYSKPFTLRSLLISTGTRHSKIKIYVSNNGQDFTEIEKPDNPRPGKNEYSLSKIYDGITTQFIKVETTAKVKLYETSFSSTQLIGDQLGRVSISKTEASKVTPIGTPAQEMIIDPSKVIDLTHQMDAHGNLTTKLPKGNWTVMRFGYTTTAAFNHPASDSGRGLEVDKYNREAVKIHYDAFTKKVIDAAMPIAPNAMKYVEIDSYEMGGQNWTTDYDSIFNSRFGYDLIPFLPIYSGRFIKNAEVTEAVTYDIRKLNSELMVENYFGYFTELSNKDGIKTYIEPYGNGPMDNLATGGKSDIPMGEFWTSFPGASAQSNPPTIVSAAVESAHLYGKNIVSAESFTASAKLNWKGNPAEFKKSGDRIWTLGVNEFMFHRFAHQPNTHVTPGMTMGPWGSHFDRTNTWWYNAGKAWFKYLARGQYMLRQGNPVYDFLLFPGDASPNPSFDPKLPAQIKYLNTNSEVLINRVVVEAGQLKLPEGTTFKALILGNIQKIELPTLRRLKVLADQGAVLIGERPTTIAQYQISQAEKDEFNALVEYIWNKPTTYNEMNWEVLLPKLKVMPDFTVKGKETYDYIHRKTETEDIYFFYNMDDTPLMLDCTFNITGKIPELWNPLTGEIVKLAQFTIKEGKTHVPVLLEQSGAVFVVFRQPINNTLHVSAEPQTDVQYVYNDNGVIQAEIKENGNYQVFTSQGEKRQFKINDIAAPYSIGGSWEVQFRKEDGYEAKHTFSTLSDWKDHNLDAIKYYSGTAIYTKNFTIDKELLKSNRKLYLDLGQVCIAARVLLNGKDLGVLWVAPYEVDITNFAKEGLNELKIEVTNLWTNRLVGDEALPDTSGYDKNAKNMPEWYVNNEPKPEGDRHTFTVFNFYKTDKDLMPSGLLGPVQLKTGVDFLIQKP